MTNSDSRMPRPRQYWGLVAIVGAILLSACGGDSNTSTNPPGTVSPPGAVTGLTATADSDTQITLSWTAPAGGAAAYRVYGGSMSDGSDRAELSDDDDNTDTSYVHSSLSAGSTRYYWVRACNTASAPSESNCSGFGTAASATTTGGTTPIFTPSADQAAIYYYRPDGNYDGWVLHLWNDPSACDSYTEAQLEGVVWPAGPAHTAVDPNFGAYWVLSLREDRDSDACANYIIHSGDDKDPDGNDQTLALSANANPNRWAFAISGVGIFESPQLPTDIPVTIAGASAHWIDAETILWNPASAAEGSDVRLHFSADASLGNIVALNANPESNQLMLTQVNGGLTSSQRALVPHLVQDWVPYSLPATVNEAQMRQLVGQQLILASHNSSGAIVKATRVQAAKVLDDLYTSGANDADEQELGIRYADNGDVTASVWAPTASAVSLRIYNDDDTKSLDATQTLTRDDNTGIWSYTGTSEDLDRKFYRFQITVFHYRTGNIETYEVTDPYSLSLSTNSIYSQFVNLDDDSLKPEGWDAHTAPTIEAPEDITIYESHVRDFSIRDATVTAPNRGKYLAFTESESDGMSHLAELNEAGMNTFHILPSFDYSTVNENAAEQIGLTNTVAELCARVTNAPVCSDGTSTSMTLLEVFESYDPTMSADELKAQALAQSMRGVDGFNWGYDPQHYFVPEGGYATDPDGAARILEMRSMVMALHEANFRVAADVVYNHTSTSGTNARSVLDRVVPGYYHRHNEVNGGVETSTCCQNTATEHRMFHKLMVDSLIIWARDYRFDAFRFDIMGHTPQASIVEALADVKEVDADNYFYGEGWDFGEVSGDRLFRQAKQTNLANTEIGTFNDRPRDVIRDAQGLFSDSPNLDSVDLIRLGLAGTLSNYMLEDFTGAEKAGSQFSRASYAGDPADIVNYVSKHDNETLWDRLQLNLPPSMTAANRVRVFHIASALPFLSQGVPFIQLGGDLMRSKSLDRNSFDAGDWFNLVDFTQMTNNWNVGLPLAQDNENSNSGGWAAMRAVLANSNVAAPTSTEIARAHDVFMEFLSIRAASPLFRLRTGAEVIDRVGFQNTGTEQTPGVIVMSIDDGTGRTDLDSNYDAIVVGINGTATAATISVRSAAGFALHATQASSVDTVVRTASFSASGGNGSFSIPAYTMAVFVKAQDASQGTGLRPIPDPIVARFTDMLSVVNTADQSETALSYSNRSGIYTGIATLTSTNAFAFRLQSSDDAHDLGFADIQAGTGSITLSAGTSDAISFTPDTAGVFRFRLDASASSGNPVLTVTKLETILSCSEITLADSSEGYAFSLSDGDGMLYVRGNHSDWNPLDKFVMNYKGQNRYQTVASFDPSSTVSASDEGVLPVQFKLASSDGSWNTQIFVQTGTAAAIDTNALSLGVDHAVALGNAGVANNLANLQSGATYSLLLTLNEATPSAGASVGTLRIDRCQ